MRDEERKEERRGQYELIQLHEEESKGGRG